MKVHHSLRANLALGLLGLVLAGFSAAVLFEFFLVAGLLTLLIGIKRQLKS
jgi:hypothetical protein